MIDAGYFAKRVQPRPDCSPVSGVREICSVSECLSPGADDWIASWRHNGLGWFNRVSDAVGVIPEKRRDEYRLFAYRIHPEVFRGRPIVCRGPEPRVLAALVQRDGERDAGKRALPVPDTRRCHRRRRPVRGGAAGTR